ncbi:PsbP-related protein [Methanosphaera sp.]|uniref:PsbP-related protein n=1 Tax=Methanosphaera sp. TaxID=2666342 RepID=UPI0025FEC1B6|nr:PsbP-related protein [Methanosphaera sp.]
MKLNKTLVLVPLLIILVVSLSGCITDGLIKSGETFEANGITFQYPESWQVVNSVAEGSVAAVASKENSQISTVIQQVPSELGTDIQSACSNNNKNLVQSPNYINLQEVKTSVNGQPVILHRYIVNEADGSQKEHVATWIQMSDGKLYVVLFNTPLESYEQERSSYDLIVGTFALQGDSNGNGSSLQAQLMERINAFFSI